MRIETALIHKARLVRAIKDHYTLARDQGMTHTEIIKGKRKLLDDYEPWLRVPRWVTAAVYQLEDELLAGLYAPKLSAGQFERMIDKAATEAERPKVPYLRWQLRVNGKCMTSNEISAAREAGDADVWYGVEGAHVWNHKSNQTFSGWCVITPPREKKETATA